MNEERDDLVVLIDENGEESEFEYLDTIEFNGSEYVVLLPVEQDDNEEDIEQVVILKIVEDPDGEDSFVTIDDENELEAVFEEFKTRMSEEYDYDEEWGLRIFPYMVNKNRSCGGLKFRTVLWSKLWKSQGGFFAPKILKSSFERIEGFYFFI